MKQDMEGLRQAIAREAERSVQRITGEAQARAEALRAEARAQAAEETGRLLEAAEAKASRMRQETVGVAGLDVQALKVRARESVLDLVFSRAAEVFESPSNLPDYPAIAVDLIEDAIAHLRAPEFVIHADPKTMAALGAADTDGSLLDRIRDRTGCQVVFGQPLLGGIGVVVESPDGHLRYDNTLQSRLARMRSALRSPVYRILVGEQP